MPEQPYDISKTDLGRDGLGWVLDSIVEMVRETRAKAGVNDVLLYYWVLAPGVMTMTGRARAPAIEALIEAYPRAAHMWSILKDPPKHPDHVAVVVFDEDTKKLYTLRMTIEDCRNTGMVS